MSYRQYGTLRYINSHIVTPDHVGLFNLTTLGSLIVHGWVVRKGNYLSLSAAGSEALDEYSKATANYRKRAGEVSERVALMLSIKSREAKKHEVA